MNQEEFKALLAQAEAEDAQAMFDVAQAYRKGDGVTLNLEKAFEWYQKAANLGHAWGMLSLGACYGAGKGVAKNEKLARHWIEKAAEAGNNRALHFVIQKSHGAKKKEWLSVYFELLVPVFKEFNKLCGKTGADSGLVKSCKAAFEELLTHIYGIESDHLYQGDDESEGLTHYTSAKVALSIILQKPDPDPDKAQANERGIATRKLRIGMAAYLNDPTEGKYVFDAMQKANKLDIQHIQNRFERFYADAEPITTNELPEQIFSLSFSKNRDNLNLWRAYGTTNGQADGVGLFIPKQTLRNFVLDGLKGIQTEQSELGEDADDFSLFEVKYGEKPVKEMWAKIQPALDALFEKIEALNVSSDDVRDEMDRCIVLALSRLIYLYKHDAYAAEEEVRAIALRPLTQAKMDERTPSRLYCETPELLFLDKGSSIILGPQTADKTALLWETRKRLALLGLDDKVSVTVSTVPFR